MKSILPYINNLILELESPHYNLRYTHPRSGMIDDLNALPIIILEASCEILGRVAICVRCFTYPLEIPYGKAECFYEHIKNEFIRQFVDLRKKEYSSYHHNLITALEEKGYVIYPKITLESVDRFNLVIKQGVSSIQISLPTRHLRYDLDKVLYNIELMLHPNYNYDFYNKIINIEDFPYRC